MPCYWICSVGHRWETPLEQTMELVVRCPICGSNGRLADQEDPPVASQVAQQFSGLAAGGGGLGTLVQVSPPPQVQATMAATSSVPTSLSKEPPVPIIPGYQIVKQIGEGGMGVVYLAKQMATNRLVALKMPRSGHFGRAEQKRFRTEAEAVARLQHPNIVQIFEVGETNGLMYMALEYCSEGSLEDHMDGTPQPAQVAAEWTETLARAMQAAHDKGIIHRDLKPANVLLVPFDRSISKEEKKATGIHAEQLKITDFGLARRLEALDSGTRTGAIMGTPSYMAPEQASGRTKEAAAQTDIYTLGAMLYEFLTGRPPFAAPTMLETLEQVRSEEPVAPSQLTSHVPKDLETICLKCLRKEPAKRYATALDLAEDLERFRQGRPVLARPIRWPERFFKWVRRHVWLALLSSLLSLSLIGALIGGIWYHFRLQGQRDRAIHHFQTSMRSIDALLVEVAAEDLSSQPHMDAKRRNLLEKALAFYQELQQMEGDDPGLGWQFVKAYHRMGDLRRLLGQYDEAEQAYQNALHRLASLNDETADVDAQQRLKADCLNFLGEIQRFRSQFASAEAWYQQALAIQEQLWMQHPDQAVYGLDLIRSRNNLGLSDKERNRLPEAKNHFRQAIALAEQIQSTGNEETFRRWHLARAYINLGPVESKLGNASEANRCCQEAVRLLESLLQMDPERREYQHELAAALINLAFVHVTAKEPEKNQEPLQRARQILNRLILIYPNTPTYRAEIANTCNSIALFVSRTDKTAADQFLKEAQEHWEQLIEIDPKITAYHGDLGLTLGNRGRLARINKDPNRAKNHLKRGIDEICTALRSNPQQPSYRESLEKQLHDMALLADPETIESLAKHLVNLLPDASYGRYRAICFLGKISLIRPKEEQSRWFDLAYDLLLKGQINDLTALTNEPDFKPFTQDPRFVAWLQKK